VAISNGMMDEGNVIVSAPYFVGGRSATAAAFAAASDVFSLRNLGRVDLAGGSGAALIPVPIRVSQIRIAFAAVTAFTAGAFAFEVHKATGFSAQATGGTQLTAVPRKTTGYPAIAATEVDAMIANAAALTPGTYTLVGGGNAPVAFAAGGTGTLPSFSDGWLPMDMCPLTLEATEGLVVRNTVAQAVGTGIFFVQVDFLRQ
jgi:hypothetical protein